MLTQYTDYPTSDNPTYDMFAWVHRNSELIARLADDDKIEAIKRMRAMFNFDGTIRRSEIDLFTNNPIRRTQVGDTRLPEQPHCPALGLIAAKMLVEACMYAEGRKSNIRLDRGE